MRKGNPNQMNKIVLITDYFKVTNLFIKIFMRYLPKSRKDEIYSFKDKYNLKEIIELLYINSSTRRRMNKYLVRAVEKYNKNIFVILYRLLTFRHQKDIFIKTLKDDTKYIEIVNVNGIEECIEFDFNKNNLFSSIDWWKKEIAMFNEVVEEKNEIESFFTI